MNKLIIDDAVIGDINSLWDLLNKLEVKGATNIQVLFNLMATHQRIVQNISELNKEENIPKEGGL